MPDLTYLDKNPPFVTADGADKVISRLNTKGLQKVYGEALPVFQLKHPLLHDFVRGIRLESDGQAANKFSYTAMHIGIVIGNLAYIESGFDEPVSDDALTIGNLEADIEGVPDAYITRYLADGHLQRIVTRIMERPQMQVDRENGEYDQLLAVGAGVIRFYAQHTLAA